MKALLLAAGKGTRISRDIEPIPKCTLPVGGVPLIRYTVNMLKDLGIDCCVCVGYKKDCIYSVLEGIPVKYYFNPFYDITNSIASLWFARDFIDDDMIIMNADVYISHKILDMMLGADQDNVMAIDKKRVKTGDYFFKTTGNGVLEKFGKDLPISERTGEYVGIAKIKKSFVDIFKQRLNEMIDNHEHQRWWENIMYSMINDKQINTIDIGDLFWSEIDYFDDYERILRYINKENTNG